MANGKAGRPYGVQPYKEPVRQLDPLVYVLRKLRYKHKITQPDLAMKTGYPVTTIHDWERGRGNPRFMSMKNWAEALGVRLAIVDADGRVIEDVDL